MFIIKIKVKGYLRNLTENTEELIDTISIKNSNVISYIIDDTKYKLIIENNKITLIRESNEFSHMMLFEENINHSSEYYLKESKYSIEFNILTTKLIIDTNKINISEKISKNTCIDH